MAGLAGKQALVGGATQGIGRACAVALAEAGASVTAMARDESALSEVVSRLAPSQGPSHAWLAIDSLEPQIAAERVARHLESRGPVEILVNNTGGPPPGPALEADPESFLTALRQHLVCNQLMTQAVVPGMKGLRYGRIINIISTSVLMPIRGLGVSNTTRGAVANWGRTLAGELAPYGITVNNILPGYTRTDRLTSLMKVKAERLGTSPEELERRIIEAIPMGRMADPAEIGVIVAFLASPAASYVTGVNLPVDGGRTATQ